MRNGWRARGSPSIRRTAPFEMTLQPLLTPEQAAELLGICTKTLLKAVHLGDIKYIQVTQRKRMFHPDDVADFIEHRRTRDMPNQPATRIITRTSRSLRYKVITFTELQAR